MKHFAGKIGLATIKNGTNTIWGRQELTDPTEDQIFQVAVHARRNGFVVVPTHFTNETSREEVSKLLQLSC